MSPVLLHVVFKKLKKLFIFINDLIFPPNLVVVFVDLVQLIESLQNVQKGQLKMPAVFWYFFVLEVQLQILYLKGLIPFIIPSKKSCSNMLLFDYFNLVLGSFYSKYGRNLSNLWKDLGPVSSQVLLNLSWNSSFLK